MTAPLDEHERRLWHAWKAAADHVRERVAEEIKSGTGLSDPDYGVLSRLVDLGEGRLRQSELAASMRWHRSRLSHQLTRMEQRGLLRRSSVEGGVLLTITAQGADAIQAARPIHAAAVRRHLIEHTRGVEPSVLLRTLEQLADPTPAERCPVSHGGLKGSSQHPT